MPSSAAVEMNFTGQNSKPGAENFQFDDCYIPMTPLKPCLLKSRPICEQRQEHWFSEEESLFSNGLAHAYGVPAYCEPSNSIDETNCFRAFGENHISHNPPIGPSGVQPGHFRSLLALANVGAAKEAEKTAAKSGSFLPIYRTQLDGSRYEASSTTSSPAKQDYGLNLWSNSSCAQDIRPLYGSSMYDVNSPPNTSMNVFKSQNMPSQLAPVTPDHQFRIVENTNDLPILRLDGTIDQVTIASEKLKENHNPDKGHGPGIDLNHTPQQKPRRRKHRPKVVIEGKPKRTPKPETPKPENPTNKRKYVRKVKLGEAPAGEKSCKRALNFSLEGEAREGNNAHPELQAQNYSSRVESKLLVQLGEGIEIALEKTQMGVAYDLTRSTNKLLEEYLALPERREMNSGNPHITAPLERDSKIDVLNNHARGKCQTVLSDETHDKQVSNTTVMGITETRQARGLKRGRLQNDDAGPICQNTNGGHYSSLHAYPAMFSENSNNGMYFPMIYKKKRSEKVHCSTMPSTAHAAEYTSCGVASTINSCGEELSCKCGLGLDQKGKTKKKRSKGPTRVRDFTSLMGIVGYGQVPYFPTERAPTPVSVDMQKYKTLNHPPTSIEALIAETQATMKKKKRFKRLSFTTSTSTGAIQMRPSTVEEITELLEKLDINSASNRFRRQERMALVPFNFRFEDQKALVLYQKDRSVAPFEGMFNPIQKRRPRPKVDIDEETNRVWNLLLENINNEGIDGTDEEKAKWWEDERRVFQGRADSFIARMHLVQGDRRFSPWKGSVLDSVVGVFLTQNVSDHLSSSAFMSLAARFPLNSTSSSRPHDEGTSIVAKEPEVYMTPDPEDTNTEVVNSNSPLGRSSSTEKSVNNSLEIFGNGLEFKGPTESSVGEREMDNALSAQFSAGSSEDSVDFSVAQDSGKLEACLRDNKEALLGTGSNSNDVIVPSFVALLQMAEISQGPGASRVESFEILGAENCRSEPSGVTTESVTQVLIQENETASNSLVGLPTDNVQSERESTNSINITTNTKQKEVESSLNAVNARSSNSSKPRGKVRNPKPSKVNWDSLRLRAQAEGKRRERQANTMDSLDWEAVRCADVSEIADTIKERGMNNLLAERIKDFLNRLVKEHGTTDLEWLRDVPPDQAKEYLLSVRGLGLKSVECVRLLTLHHLAFPVDTNVGRIAVRLGWVPLQPLPESLQLHLLELYPVLESIQRYLWPRLCKLDQKTLYELHYQMITFGKVFCTKSKPNCNACPMRGECRHFASAFASARLGLPGPEEKSIVSVRENKATFENPVEIINHLQLPLPPSDQQLQAQSRLPCVPLVEVPASPEPTIEIPLTPEFEALSQIPDIEDAFSEDPEEIPTIKLNIEEFTQNLQNYMHQKMELQEFDVSKALVALTPDAASIPIPKLKNVNRLRTEHHVYELPDSHPLLEGLDRREPDDPCSYLLAIWTPGETANSITPPEGKCSAQEFGMLCNEMTCFSCNSVREANSQTVRGTLLIPCRTAMRGSFPLNGTYFQVNEVFADHDSSMNPIDVPRAWIWNLPRRTVYFGTSIPSIFKGLSTEAIQYCFWRGFVCLRGFDQKLRAPRPLMARLHFPASKLTRSRGKPTDRHQQPA